MEKSEKVAKYYEEDHQFKNAISELRDLALKSELEETFKWSFPTYTINNKNVLSICKFKNHFGIWFFNGVFLKDEKGILENAQEGKTKAMRHWKFSSIEEIDKKMVLAYINEAIDNQKKGIELKPIKKREASPPQIPKLLSEALRNNKAIGAAFKKLSTYKQKEYAEYISSAKRETTKLSRLDKILPMILAGNGLNDAYK